MKNMKVFIKQRFRALFTVMIIPFLLWSCSSESKTNSANQAIEPIAQTLTQTQEVSANKLYEIVPSEKVCMVNDKFMGIPQIPIEVEGIMYYGCCQNCVKKLQENLQGVRYSSDPISKQKVDKANAIAVRNLQDNTITYFKSEASANEFMNK